MDADERVSDMVIHARRISRKSKRHVGNEFYLLANALHDRLSNSSSCFRNVVVFNGSELSESGRDQTTWRTIRRSPL